MNSCSVHYCVLFLLILAPVSSQTVTYQTAKLNKSATLTCKQTCFGPMEWKMFHKPDVLAYCDLKSCHSEKGYEVSHDQYQNGNLNLVIRSVDFSRRTIFSCYCDNKLVCDFRLFIEPLTSQVYKMPGDALVLDLPIPEPMEVVYKSRYTTDLYGEWICNVIYGSLQCGDNYKKRASLSHTELTLQDLEVSDSGVYTIRDIKNDAVIHSYILSVEECHQHFEKTERCDSAGTIVAAVMIPQLVVFGLVVFALKLHLHRTRKAQKQPQEERLLNDEEERLQSRERSNSNERISQLMKQITLVDELMQQYGNGGEKWFQSGMSSREITEKLLRKKAEMEEFIHKWNSERPELNELNEWWSKKKEELDKIIAEHRKERPARESFRGIIQDDEALAGQSQTEPYSVPFTKEEHRGLLEPPDNWQCRSKRTVSDGVVVSSRREALSRKNQRSPNVIVRRIRSKMNPKLLEDVDH